MGAIPEFNAELLTRYNKPVPRYTSYPTAPQFNSNITQSSLIQALDQRDGARPLSLYLHIPFCRSLCYYCACNKIITTNASRSIPYLESVTRELKLTSDRLSRNDRQVSQIHLGGGTPTFLACEQLTDLFRHIESHFSLASDGEYSIEIDPRASSVDMIRHLVTLGFNRMSFGIQDFDPDVQKAINRVQSSAETFSQINAARAHGVRSINVDLIYGLPLQTKRSFARTLDTVIGERPDRIAVYGYAHLPGTFKSQQLIDKHYLPLETEKIALLELAINKFLNAGYEYIGMDHFALPEDELAIARREGTLQRNFQGYSTRIECDMLGFGVTSIGKLGDLYYQNEKVEKVYMERVHNNELPLAKGYQLTFDDVVRRGVIMVLMCQGRLNMQQFERTTGHAFFQYFSDVIPELLELTEDGLLTMSDWHVEVTQKGQLLLRNICNVFDAYRKQTKNRHIATQAI